jgi:hypothetical protein
MPIWRPVCVQRVCVQRVGIVGPVVGGTVGPVEPVGSLILLLVPSADGAVVVVKGVLVPACDGVEPPPLDGKAFAPPVRFERIALVVMVLEAVPGQFVQGLLNYKARRLGNACFDATGHGRWQHRTNKADAADH